MPPDLRPRSRPIAPDPDLLARRSERPGRVRLPATALLLWPRPGRLWTRRWSGRDVGPPAVPWGGYLLAAAATPVLVGAVLGLTGWPRRTGRPRPSKTHR